MRKEHHSIDPFEAPEGIDGGAPRVPGGPDDHRHVLLVPVEEELVQLAHNTEGEVLERQSGPVEKLRNIEAILQSCDIYRSFWDFELGESFLNQDI